MKCAFCDEKIEEQSFYETKNFFCLYNLKPILPGHSLIIPKRHVKSFLDLTESELKEMFSLAQKTLKILKRAYNSDGFDLALQDSKEAGQSVFHVHLHLLPRKKGDIDGDPSSWFSLILENNNRDIPEQEMKENIEKIKKSMVK